MAVPDGVTITCPNGTSATLFNGEQGEIGPQGIPGLQGVPGTEGTAGTVITVIQLCNPSFVPTYPNIFPEVALEINGLLYAVYSQNNGFLVLLTPGTYSSNGIGASCTFTVNPNNTISN